MSPTIITTIIVLAVLVAVLVALYFFGKRTQKKQEENEQQLEAIKQTVPLLVIDKKKMRLKNAGLPAIVFEKTPFYLRYQKVPVVKAKVGPKVMTLLCDNKIFDMIPLKKEVKADVSGIYITGVKGMRGPIEIPVKEKKGFFGKKKK